MGISNLRGATSPGRFVNPVALSTVCLAAIAYGVGYLLADSIDFVGETARLVRVVGTLPFEVYGAIWTTLGTFGLIGMYNRRLFRFAFSTLCALFMTWALVYLTAVFITGTQGYGALISAMVWLSMTVTTSTLVTIELTNEKIVDHTEAVIENDRRDSEQRSNDRNEGSHE